MQSEGNCKTLISLSKSASDSLLEAEDFAKFIAETKISSWILNLETQSIELQFEIIHESQWKPVQISLSANTAINLIHPEDRQQIYNAFQKSVQQKTTFSVQCRINQTKECWIEIRGQKLLRSFNSPPLISGRIIEISQEVERQRQSISELKEQIQKIELASKNKSFFLANMSHEIRSPLSAILGFSEILSEEQLASPKQKKYVEIIRRNGNSLAKLVDDVLDLSKVEAGSLKLEKLQFSFPELIDEVGALFEEKLRNKKLAFTNKIIGRFPDVIISDSSRIRQILINLISNAIKFTDKGGITLTTQYRIINDRQIEVKFKVRDTGIGLTEEQKRQLFVPYAQAEHSTARLFGGTGLGLALSKKLAEALNGDLVIDENPETAGACFKFTFKAEVLSSLPSFPTKVTSLQLAPLVPRSLSGMSVLLVEDSLDTQFLVERILRGHGIKTQIVSDGEEAIRKCYNQTYDLILMDIKLPKIDGYETTRILRSTGYTKPIVALTAHALENEKTQSLLAGCNGHLSKPINMQKLFSTLDTFLKQKS